MVKTNKSEHLNHHQSNTPAVLQLGFEKDRVQFADGGHFYAWKTILRAHRWNAFLFNSGI